MSEIYSNDRNLDEVLKSGEYRDHKWVIRTLGRYPCAYVSVVGKMSYDEAEPLETPYGGISYASDDFGRLECLDAGYSWIGWDYGHCGDYNALFPDFGGDKHTIEEIETNIKEVIDELERKN